MLRLRIRHLCDKGMTFGKSLNAPEFLMSVLDIAPQQAGYGIIKVLLVLLTVVILAIATRI